MENQISAHREYLNGLSSIIIGAAVTVHKEMGPGLLEAVYQLCMVKELQSRNIVIAQSVPVPLFYKSEPLNKDYIIDLLVENEIIIELKAVEGLLPVHEAQILSYLKLANKRLGFLINFNVPLIKLGFKRYVNGF
jgi:GxxExxY protein